jgi:hypothetical protein
LKARLKGQGNSANEIDKTNAHRNCAKRVGQRRPRRAADQEECPQEMREAGLCVKSSSVVVAVVVHRPHPNPNRNRDRRERWEFDPDTDSDFDFDWPDAIKIRIAGG